MTKTGEKLLFSLFFVIFGSTPKATFLLLFRYFEFFGVSGSVGPFATHKRCDSNGDLNRGSNQKRAISKPDLSCPTQRFGENSCDLAVCDLPEKLEKVVSPCRKSGEAKGDRQKSDQKRLKK